ncbi:GDSL-like Lipase/Acylhydrolase-domain-containing protein [Syncephalis pseudoplumigaleata]|uniref:GDSL-like Lipase/Acylhydrolase-domain-containing protein n=1 Tax=Syncephalis pseudoplumigaleata TaxID=1712513 RepID=A0A4P9Z3X4_9FUNG|nr:GDSL-like Lipase/Acylhydrolase-domain-containing protein [Syncephalis pseudoplumigaleata]|eukprot:RKP27176.1 GDSL-like Lipase/Acylhydrolase-domain-containing protein [Syncephalis pseudoplumigaleata]
MPLAFVLLLLLLRTWTRIAAAYQLATQTDPSTEREIISRLMIDGATDGTVVWPILSPTTYFNTAPITRAKSESTTNSTFWLPKKMVVFGDSMSDNGNFFRRSLNFYPPNYCYFSGRFSNGPVWVDRLAELIDGLEVENYAYGGAVSSESLLPTKIPLAKDIIPSVTDQVNQLYLSALPEPGADNSTKAEAHANDTLYVIWAGGNDYFELIKRDDVQERIADHPRMVTDTLFKAVDALYTRAGARRFLVFNLPAMDYMPRFLNAEMKSSAMELHQLVDNHNRRLAENIEHAADRWPKSNIQLLDAHSMMTRVRASPRKYGFTDVSTACMKPRAWGFLGGRVCRDPHQHFFWDDVHPGWRAHMLCAETVYKLFRDKPELFQL